LGACLLDGSIDGSMEAKTSLLLAVADFLHPRLSSPAMQERYDCSRRQRLLPLLRWLSAGYLLFTLLLMVVPADGLESKIWYFVSIQSLVSGVAAALTVALLHFWPLLWRHYDFLCCLWACHCLTCQLLPEHHLRGLFLGAKEVHAGSDDGYILLVSAGCIAGFAACVQTNMLCLLVVTHWTVAVNVSLRIHFASNGELPSSVKLLTAYYLTCIVVMEHARRVEQQRQEIFSLHAAHDFCMHTCIDDSTAQSMAMPRLKAMGDAGLERAMPIGSETACKWSADASVSSVDLVDELEAADVADAADATAELEDVTEAETEDVWVWVESTEDGFPVLTCSNAFVQYNGPLLSGTKLIDLMVGDTLKFQKWLHVCVNNILDNSTEFMTPCHVKLGRRFSLNPQPTVEAECCVDLDKMMFEWTDMHDGALPVPLRFAKIVQNLEECGAPSV